MRTNRNEYEQENHRHPIPDVLASLSVASASRLPSPTRSLSARPRRSGRVRAARIAHSLEGC